MEIVLAIEQTVAGTHAEVASFPQPAASATASGLRVCAEWGSAVARPPAPGLTAPRRPRWLTPDPRRIRARAGTCQWLRRPIGGRHMGRQPQASRPRGCRRRAAAPRLHAASARATPWPEGQTGPALRRSASSRARAVRARDIARLPVPPTPRPGGIGSDACCFAASAAMEHATRTRRFFLARAMRTFRFL
jgi:hypothetical protein